MVSNNLGSNSINYTTLVKSQPFICYRLFHVCAAQNHQAYQNRVRLKNITPVSVPKGKTAGFGVCFFNNCIENNKTRHTEKKALVVTTA